MIRLIKVGKLRLTSILLLDGALGKLTKTKTNVLSYKNRKQNNIGNFLLIFSYF